jgi:hypothetical protein
MVARYNDIYIRTMLKALLEALEAYIYYVRRKSKI